MARTRIDLNRFKKIYPLQRKSPVYFQSNDDEVESFSIQATAGSATKQLDRPYTTPIVVATAADQNVNVWVSNISVQQDGTTTVTISASDNQFAGMVHVQVTEATI